MILVTCISVGSYSEALTRGKVYDVIETDTDKDQIRLEADNGRTDWFPVGLFDIGDVQLPRLESFTIDDEIGNPYMEAVEVTLTIKQGDATWKRWCYFATPSYLYHQFDFRSKEPILVGSHCIILPQLTADLIESSLRYLEAQDLLFDHSRPLNQQNMEYTS